MLVSHRQAFIISTEYIKNLYKFLSLSFHPVFCFDHDIRSNVEPHPRTSIRSQEPKHWPSGKTLYFVRLCITFVWFYTLQTPWNGLIIRVYSAMLMYFILRIACHFCNHSIDHLIGQKLIHQYFWSNSLKAKDCKS